MKQKDVAVIIIIVFVSAVVSFVVSNKLFVTSSARQQKGEVVDVIQASFESPDKKYFNSDSINATPNSAIGTDSNDNPFNGSGK
jgi:mannitol-specific phosphotransferase system IIBC component